MSQLVEEEQDEGPPESFPPPEAFEDMWKIPWWALIIAFVAGWILHRLLAHV